MRIKSALLQAAAYPAHTVLRVGKASTIGALVQWVSARRAHILQQFFFYFLLGFYECSNNCCAHRNCIAIKIIKTQMQPSKAFLSFWRAGRCGVLLLIYFTALNFHLSHPHHTVQLQRSLIVSRVPSTLRRLPLSSTLNFIEIMKLFCKPHTHEDTQESGSKIAAFCCSICFNKHCDRTPTGSDRSKQKTHSLTAGRPVDAAFIKLSWPSRSDALLVARTNSAARGPTSSFNFLPFLPPHFPTVVTSVITVQAAASEQSDNDLYSLKRFMAISSNIYSSMNLSFKKGLSGLTLT